MTHLEFRDAFLVLGALNCLNILAGLLFFPKSKDTENIEIEKHEKENKTVLKIKGKLS